MKKAVLLTLLTILLAACGTNEPAQQPEASTNSTVAENNTPVEIVEVTEPEQPTDEPMTEEVMEEEPTMEEAPSPATDLPFWQTTPMIDARTGEIFALSDFAGKTVFVEPMATWCPNCRNQLFNVSTARSQLNSDDVVFIALSVETNLDDSTLADYANSNGFDWRFAVVSPEILQSLVETFGRTVSNAPSTPHFLIRPDGTHTDLSTGPEPAADLISEIQEAQS